MTLKCKYFFLLIVYLLTFQMGLYGKQSNSDQHFSENLEKLRSITNDLSFQNILLVDLIVNNSNFRGNLAFALLVTRISKISSLSGVYVNQLNTFDTVIEKRSGQKALPIPRRSGDYCCWKSISLVHMRISYDTQETLKAEKMQNLNHQSPQILHQVKTTLEGLNACLTYFGNYFANRGWQSTTLASGRWMAKVITTHQ